MDGFVRMQVLWGCLFLHLHASLVLGLIGGDCEINAVLRSQDQIDGLKADCTRVKGSVNIECNATSQVTSLEAFRLIEEITGFLRIEGCNGLENFEPGFENLKAIHGEILYTAPGVGDGFALYLSQNSGLLSLGGLQNLTSVAGNRTRGLGRAYIVQNDQLCWASKMDWLVAAGDNWRRAVYEIPGTETECDGSQYTCHESCSCDLCTGPLEKHCQGLCTGTSSEADVLTVTTLALLMVIAVIVFIFGVLFVTDRCGCKLRYYSLKIHFGIEETERHKRVRQKDNFSIDRERSQDSEDLFRKKNDDPFQSLPE